MIVVVKPTTTVLPCAAIVAVVKAIGINDENFILGDKQYFCSGKEVTEISLFYKVFSLLIYIIQVD